MADAMSKHIPMLETVPALDAIDEILAVPGLDIMLIPYAVSLDKVRETVALYQDSLANGGHDPAEHKIMGPLHLHVDQNGDKAIKNVREPIVRYVSVNDRFSTHHGANRKPVRLIINH